MDKDDGEPEVKLASGPSTAFTGEVVKIKGKRMTREGEPIADRPGGEWERSHCSKLLSRKSTHLCYSS